MRLLGILSGQHLLDSASLWTQPEDCKGIPVLEKGYKRYR